mmetsp:Transcript_30312/g.78397  ORF Transcript_30312/g.78397 Transcript_30312/m.78397 type:complete len:397 (+) Transcript_30312:242-1432(+)
MAAAGWAMRVLPSLTQLRNAATRPITTPLRAGLCSTYHRRGVYYSLHGATAGGHARRRLCATAAQSQDSAATKAELGGSGPRDGQAGESQGQDAEMPAEVVGRVMTSKANFVTVELDPEVRGSVPHPSLLCNVKSLLKKMQQRVLVGDRVKVVSIDWQDGRGLVGEVIDRQSELLDPPIANVDQVLLVFAASDPPFDVTQVTRFLVATEIARIPITVVLNKCDLLPQEEVSRLVAQLGDWGYSAVPISVYAKLGLDALEQTLQGRITVLAGPSGVGKSSIINFVRMKSIAQGYAEEEAGDADGGEGLTQEMLDSLGERVGTVGRTGRGRHTTRHTTLLTLPNGGIVADTPGFNQPALDDFNPSDLASAFPEIRQRMGHGQCTFNDCKHLQVCSAAP